MAQPALGRGFGRRTIQRLGKTGESGRVASKDRGGAGTAAPLRAGRVVSATARGITGWGSQLQMAQMPRGMVLGTGEAVPRRDRPPSIFSGRVQATAHCKFR